MSAESAFIGGLMVLCTWALLTFFLAVYGEDRKSSFLHPGKRVGERGILVVCRWTFLFLFAPAVNAVLLGYISAMGAPDKLKRLWKWLLEKG